MAVEDSVVAERIRQIQAEEGGDTDRARYRIAQEAQAAGVTGDQIARSLGGDLTGSQVNEMARAVGVGLPGYTPPERAGVANRSGNLNAAQSGGGQSGGGQSDGGGQSGGGLTAEEERFMANLPENLRQTYSDLAIANRSGQFSSSIQNLLESGMTPSDLVYAMGGYQPQTYGEVVSVIDRALAEGSIDPATAEYAKQQIQLQPAAADTGGLTAEEERFMGILPENLRETYSQIALAGRDGQLSSTIQDLLQSGMTPSELVYATGGYQPQTYEEVVAVIDRALAEGTIDPATAAYARQQIQLQPAGTDLGTDLGTGLGTGLGTDGYTLSESEQKYLSGLEGELATIYNIWATGIGSGRSHGEMIDELRSMGYNYDQIMRAIGLGGVGTPPGGLGAVGTEQPGAGPTFGTMASFDYSTFPGGIYGPGQALPNIFTPVTPGAAPGTAPPAAAPGAVPPAAQGPTTMVSPGITTYAYPNPFSGVDIFNRPFGS